MRVQIDSGTARPPWGAVGVLIELDEPTSEMKRAAVEAGQYESVLWGGKYERIQILTVSQLLAGKKPNVPKFLATLHPLAGERSHQPLSSWLVVLSRAA